MKYTVGCVPYVNAVPLASALEAPGSDVRVIYDVPSKLPALLESGEAQAILVSSVDALRVAGRRMAAGVCIGSQGEVQSVRLFSRVPPSEIRSLALDASSMTSNRLAQLILAERYGVQPRTEFQPPAVDEMLRRSDACVLIGDIGMMAPSEGLHVIDLGAEWRALTGLPFMWAAWIGRDGLDAHLARLLREAAEGPIDAEMVSRVVERWGWRAETVRDYLTRTMDYRMDERMLEGLREFQRRLLSNGFADCGHFPTLVE